MELGETEVDPIFLHSNLTRSQYLIWMGQALAPDAPASNMAMAFDLGNEIDVNRLLTAFQHVVDDNDALRMVFDEVGGVPRQRVLGKLPATVELVELPFEQLGSAGLDAWLENRARKMLNLSQQVFDAAVLKLRDNRVLWYLNQHHLVTDAASSVLIYRRLLEAYFDFPATEKPSYLAYCEHERLASNSDVNIAAADYWKANLATFSEDQRGGYYGYYADRASTQARHIRHRLDATRSKQLRQLAASREVHHLTEELSVFNIFHTLLVALMHRVSGCDVVRVGAPVHNRVNMARRKTAGLFSEVFPLQVTVEAGDDFASLLGKSRGASRELLTNGVAGAGTARLSGSYDVLLNFIPASFPQIGNIKPSVHWVLPGHIDAGHSLRLQVADLDGSGSYDLYFDINEGAFPQSVQTVMIDQFLRLMDAMLDDLGRLIDHVNLLGGSDMLAWDVFNDTETVPPGDSGSVLHMLDRMVAYRGGDIALEQDGDILTYRQLDSRVEQLAGLLRRREVGRGKLVGICLPRSIELVISILGILRAGAAYLPMDRQTPVERQRYMLKEAGVDLVVCDERLSGLGEDIVFLLAAELPYELAEQVLSPLGHEELLTDLAYVMYTSGSTGQPKGVAISHGSLAAYINWAADVYLDGEVPDGGWVMPLFTAFTFDLTVTSLFLPLVTGGRLLIYPEDELAADLSILRVLEEDRVNLIKMTPAHLSLVKELNPVSSGIQRMILGGEELRTGLAVAINESIPGVEIFNEYGPTEATVGCMIHRYRYGEDNENSVPIGRPARHMRVYVLTAAGELVVRGAIGEIYLSGAGLALGYLGREDLTQQRFIPDPFHPGERMYRTGDLGSLGTDGLLRYHGRADQQLKLKGMRVEPVEIEAAILSLPGVHGVIVDAVPTQRVAANTGQRCTRCGLPGNVPDVYLDAKGVCNLCRDFETYHDKAMNYFSDMAEFSQLSQRMRAQATGRGSKQDCIVLLSGGKDSTYMLYQLVEHGLRPLVFCLDNGFISEGAKQNIGRAVEDLGLEVVFGRTGAMNEVFADSLKTFSNVCNGCFKVIYTLATTLAVERGIGYIVTGLSRGQIFDTRLKEMFQNKVFDVDDIDQMVIEARRAYHRVDDVVRRCVDTDVFEDNDVFEKVQYVDFYRYCDVELAQLYRFLDEKAPWVRPADTGRSTNCLINDVGIWVHKNERGYHNYAEPYSWDVRLGHKQRDAALAELEDEIDVGRVRRVLSEIGYAGSFSPAGDRAELVAWYTADADLDVLETRQALANWLPGHMIPAKLVRLESIPLTTNGKVDRAALAVASNATIAGDFTAPTSEAETILAGIWAELLGRDAVGVHDHYIDLGGDSITSIQVVSRAREQGLVLRPRDIFEHPTVAQLARLARPIERSDLDGASPFSRVKSSELDKIASLLGQSDVGE
jgi:amino acid adenylation domain-containing protein